MKQVEKLAKTEGRLVIKETKTSDEKKKNPAMIRRTNQPWKEDEKTSHEKEKKEWGKEEKLAVKIGQKTVVKKKKQWWKRKNLLAKRGRRKPH